jgi:MarR family transcriptional regulator, negative regulator of the multidrug operon emrRAB
MDLADRALNENSLTNSTALLDTLLRVSQIVRVRFNEWLTEFDLNEGRYSVLQTLARAGDDGLSQAELAERLGQSESNVSTLIERMQRDGLVDRSRSEADRRKRVLLISSRGRSTLDAVDDQRMRWTGRLFKGMPVADSSQLVSSLDQLAQVLKSASENHVTLMKPNDDGSVDSQTSTTVLFHSEDPIDSPGSPQFALQQMLLALSVHANTETAEKEVA